MFLLKENLIIFHTVYKSSSGDLHEISVTQAETMFNNVHCVKFTLKRKNLDIITALVLKKSHVYEW